MTQDVSTWLHWAVSAALFIFAFFFLIRYVLPSWRLGNELRAAHQALTALKERGTVLDLERVAQEAMSGPALPHCWSEYRDTLHRQYGQTAMGERVVTRLRATAMASAFFNETTLIDGRMATEFFKHLPGLLTGLGIIGTFSGLILGLQAFQVSDDATVVRQGLQGLLLAVSGAFRVSAAAIALAMVVTLVEKVLISRRLAELERLVGLIDSLFESGAGEEYLQKLVESSESSATQAQQIKDALVSDLRSILQELTQAQINAAVAGHEQTAQAISVAIQDGLKEPLNRISDAVQNVSQQQGDAVNRMLTDVLASFAQQMREMFGGQLSGMNEVLAETARSIQVASSRFDTLATQLQDAGNDAASAMAKRMEALMESMSARQAEADAHMAEFLQTVRQSVQEGQSESAELMMNTFAELSKTTSELVSQMRQQTDRAAQEGAQQVRQLSSETAALLEQQSAAVQTLVANLGHQAERTAQDSAHQLRQVGTEAVSMLERQSAMLQDLLQATDQATAAMRQASERAVTGANASVERMATGADRLHGAASVLESSLGQMATASRTVEQSVQELRGASTELSTASRAAAQALNDQQAVRSSIATMVEELGSIVDSARREASMTSEIIQSIERSAEALKVSAGAADIYLHQVNEVLSSTHESFASQLTSTLRQGNATFQEELAQAVDMLRGAIQDLGDTLDGLPERH